MHFHRGARYSAGSIIWLPAGDHLLQGGGVTNVLRLCLASRQSFAAGFHALSDPTRLAPV